MKTYKKNFKTSKEKVQFIKQLKEKNGMISKDEPFAIEYYYANTVGDRNYTHYAIRKSDNKIATGWDYRQTDKDDIKYYSKEDLKDIFPDDKPSDFKIVTTASLLKANISPFDSKNWFKTE